MKNSFSEAEDLDGFDELQDEDQDRVQKAWEDGRVADEDIPESARKPAGEGEDDEDDDGEKKPKKKSAKAKKDDASAAPTKGTFSLEYATSGRAKCKGNGKKRHSIPSGAISRSPFHMFLLVEYFLFL